MYGWKSKMGKPKGKMTVHTLLSRLFNFTPVIKIFLSENKKYIVKNCMHEFSEEEYNLMKNTVVLA